MSDELVTQGIAFINLMFWFFAIVGMGIIGWNYKDDIASFGKVKKTLKKSERF